MTKGTMNKGWKLKKRNPLVNGPAVTEYYIKTAKRFRVLKYMTVLVLVLFVLVTVTLNREAITVENFRYLIRYLDINATVYSYSGGHRDIGYSADSELTFGMYRGDAVIADSTSLRIKSLGGSTMLDNTTYISNPVLLCGSKYLMLYDLGGNSYQIYNTFSELYGESCEYSISGAAMSDTGVYAIVTKSAEYRSIVQIYNKDFKMISRVYKDKLVMDTAFRSDGSLLAIVSAFNREGDFYTEVMVCDPYSDEPVFTASYQDLLPVSVCYHSDGGLTVICDKKILFFNERYELISEYAFGSRVPSYCKAGDGCVIAAMARNIVGDDNIFLIFDSAGRAVFEGELSGKIVCAENLGTETYVLTSSALARVGRGREPVLYSPIEKNSIAMMLPGDGTVFICYTDNAVSYRLDSMFETGQSAGESNDAAESTDSEAEDSVTAAPEIPGTEANPAGDSETAA